jgi:hypothetical protein
MLVRKLETLSLGTLMGFESQALTVVRKDLVTRRT